jgi:hypothetical protein
MSMGGSDMTELIGYRKAYRLRTAVPGRKSIEVTFPYEVVEREARSRGLTIGEFLKRFQAIVEYDNFDGVIYRFEEIEREVGGGR